MRETKLPEMTCECGDFILSQGIKRLVIAVDGDDAGVRKGQRRNIHKRKACEPWTDRPSQ
jgi:hypothetical protein